MIILCRFFNTSDPLYMVTFFSQYYLIHCYYKILLIIMSNPPQHFISLNSCTVWKSLINLRLSPHMTLGLEKAQSIPLNWKLVEPAVFILKQDNRDRRQSYINSGYINVIHYNELNTLTLLPEGETCETKHRGEETAEEADRQWLMRSQPLRWSHLL